MGTKAQEGSRRSQALIGVFVLVTASFVAATAYSQHRAASIDEAATEIALNASPSIETLTQARSDLGELQVRMYTQVGAVGSGQPFDEQALRASRHHLREDLERYARLPMFIAEDVLRARMEVTLHALDTVIDEVVAALRASQVDVARRVASTEARRALIDAGDALRDTTAFNARHAGELARRIEESRSTSMRIAFALDVLCVFASAAAAYVVARVIGAYGRVVERRNELLAREAAELDAFASRVAHDIVNPLGTIAIAIDIAKQKNEDEYVSTLLARAGRGVERANAIVGDLLTFARSGARPDGASAELRAVVSGTLDELADEAKSANVALSAPEIPECRIACSPGVLTSIVWNLARNAIRYMDEAEERRVTIHARREIDAVAVDVVDTGPGIPDAMADVIFLPHVRGRTAGTPGLGLGLATVKRLVEAHGGKVHVRSTIRGSVFSFDLPLVKA